MANEPFVFSDDVKVSGDTRWLRRDEFDSYMANWFQPVEVYISGTPLIANSSQTTLDWTAEHFDPFSLHNPAVNPSRITIAKAGKYFVHAGIKFLSNATGTRILYLLKNGTIQLGIERSGTSVFDIVMLIHRQFDLAVGDYLQIAVFQNSGGDLTLYGAGQYNAFFGAFRTGN
ncbi:MAG TPA: hypothetical protein VJ044_07675 [Candidatus Hodarchaeales archaeon]|nr:hypothetical protein [Candidatus Hodarchaeales archaeon]